MKLLSFGPLLGWLVLIGPGADSSAGEPPAPRPAAKPARPDPKPPVDELKEALAIAQQALEAADALFGSDSMEAATALARVAELFGDLGKSAEAEPLLLRSLKIREAKLGKDHPEVTAALNNLGALYRGMGLEAKAEPMLQRGLQSLESRLGKDHPVLIIALDNLAAVYELTGQTKKAAALLDRSRRITRGHLAGVLPALSETEQADFLELTEQVAFPQALSLGLRHLKDSEVAARSAGWLLNGKAMVHQALAESTLLLRDSKDPALAELAGQLRDVRQELARQTLAQPKPGQAAQARERRAKLTWQEQELSRLLRLAGGFGREANWVELDTLRQRLPRDAVFIDIARFAADDFRAQPAQNGEPTARYVAWVTPARGEVALVDLGPAEAIDQAVREVRRGLEGAVRDMRKRGEPDAEAALRGPLAKLSRLVLHPLLPHVGKAPRWIVSPDGNLWLVPWAALLLPDGKYAVEEHGLSYVVSGRDLVTTARAQVKPTAPLVLADPDFDLGRSDKGREPRPAPVRPDRSGPGSPAVPAALDLGSVPRLPGTATEAAIIAPKLGQYTGLEPTVCTEKQALARVFQAARNPKVVVLSTHGYFLPRAESAPNRQPDPEEKTPQPPKDWDNPLLRCGLLLAGCNNARAVSGQGDNGVLTGLQIVGTDLRGCELVVLSACETGLGVVRNGEGVAGLRQAFQLAGAQSVVATLWQVPDQQSAQLMIRFFDNLADRQTRADALRNAQLAVLKTRRAKHDAAHPYFWAAFTLTGP